MKRLFFLIASAIILLLNSCTDQKEPLQKKQDQGKPNVVFFLIDDLGYSDLGCYGSEYYETPAIDKLAQSGIKFTQNYSASTVCSPTRASILSGKYPARVHMTHAIPVLGSERRENPILRDADYSMNLSLDEETIGDAFQQAGYVTAAIGKWHVTNDEAHYPDKNGFDYNIGGNQHGNPGNYFYPYDGKWQMTPRHEMIYWNTLPDGEQGEYLTDRLGDEAVKIIEKHKDQPFFLYFAHYAVHSPLQAKEDYINKYKLKNPDRVRDHKNADYAAMIQSVDESVQKVMLKLEELGLAKNTIVVFTSDNGGAHFATSNWPWRGNKGNFYEGGIRVPLIISWPDKIVAGKESSLPVISMDYYPTLLELCDIPLKPTQHVDGKSFSSLLLNQNSSTQQFYNRDLFWHFPHYIGSVKKDPTNPCSVVRSGDWKLIQQLEDWSVELYNLKEDPRETTDLSKQNPEKVKELVERLIEFRMNTKVQMPSVNPGYKPDYLVN